MTDYNLSMTVEEICRDYRTAKDKRNQIEILADRNVCTKEAIEDVLRSRGEELPGPPEPRGARWTGQEETRLLQLAGEGKSSTEIAKLMGRTQKAVAQKAAKMRIAFHSRQLGKLEALPTEKDIMTPAPAPEKTEPDRTLIELPLKVVEGTHVNKSTGLTRDELLALLWDVLYSTDLNANLQTVFARFGVKILDYLKKGNTYEQ